MSGLHVADSLHIARSELAGGLAVEKPSQDYRDVLTGMSTRATCRAQELPGVARAAEPAPRKP